jgi:secondary thiamine-phosphate synthase enzyme
MKCHQATLAIETSGRGMIEITREISQAVRGSRLSKGMATVFCRHTSCSLVLMENADPSARSDLEAWMGRLVREDDAAFTHTLEGRDDMPSHIRMALTRSSESIPFDEGRLLLGTWQGIFLWEHRRVPHRRELVVALVGE